MPTTTSNIYSALDTDSDKRSLAGSTGNKPSGRDQYSSKGPSLERQNYRQHSDGKF